MTSPTAQDNPTRRSGLARDMGLVALTATGIASMVGAGINIIPFMIQRNVPGIGAWVLPAFLFAAVPAFFAGLAYSILASAMPRAGGSYVYASRALNPYLGFIASFSQWFALCVAIGVVSYVLVPFLRDIAIAAQWQGVSATLDSGAMRLAIPLAVLWAFTAVNILGIKSYERILVPLLGLTFVLGGVVIVAGFLFTHADFARAVLVKEGRALPQQVSDTPSLRVFFTAATVLFSGYIGFDAIAQAGGEAKNPNRTLPLAIGLAILLASTFYMLFAAAVYHAVPWQYVAEQSVTRTVNAPGLLGYVLPAGWTVVIVAGGAVALAKDVPAMLLSVSRLMFAWAEDGIFPSVVATLHPRHRTPHIAILASATMATVAILGCHLAGDFFLGVDILVTAMLANYILMCVSVLTLPRRNPRIARDVRVLPNRGAQVIVSSLGIVVLGTFLAVHTWKDLTAPVAAWYFRSTPVWILVMCVATVIFLREVSALRRRGVNVNAIFAELPPD
ncbi:MAG: APC family permease [Gemmatimonadaceae bacterium]|nr:APC family permease [Gemmatimonadaceae bacterium]